MNKKELRQKLEDLYFIGLISNYLDLNAEWVAVFSLKNSGQELIDEMGDIEIQLYGQYLNLGAPTTTKVPWKKAVKRYQEIVNSPLYQALNEQEEDV